jgi:nitric oxide reductase subunit C
MNFDDPAFWRAGAISTVLVMSVVLIMLTIDSLAAISPGSSNVPMYTVINQHIDYKFDAKRGNDVPVTGGPEPLFGKAIDAAAAETLIGKGKLVIQSRACIDCHTFFGNGAYYAPDLTRAWVDPFWARYDGPKRADRLAKFLMHPIRLGARPMPNLHIQRDEAEAAVAYLKWLSGVDSNGFPDRFGATAVQAPGSK